MGMLLSLVGCILLPLLWIVGYVAAIVSGLLSWATPMRYAIGAGLLLAAVPPYVYLTSNSLLVGLFVLETGPRIITFTAMSMMAALVVVGTFQAARVNRPTPAEADTVAESSPLRRRLLRINVVPLLFFFAIGAVAPVVAGLMTAAEYAEVELEPTGGGAAHETYRPEIVASGLIGAAVGLGLAMLVGVYQSLVTHDRFAQPGIMPFEFDLHRSRSSSHRLASFLSRFPIMVRRLPDGSHVLAPGVATLASLLLLSSGLYVLLMMFPRLFSAREIPGAGSMLAAGFYALLLLSIGTLFIGGLAFICDQRRIPALLVVLLALVPAFCFPAADSYFALVPPEPVHKTSAVAPPEWKSVFVPPENQTAWRFPHKLNPADPRPTMVVVVAPGGGIQAAAWTTRVLTGLDELYEDFSESIGLLSSVSGGSVGVMYYLVGRGDRTNDPDRPMSVDPKTTGFNINWQVRKSSLDSVAWALSYPKAVRPIRLFVPTDEDHGWALKTSWHLRLRQMVHDDAAADENMYDDRLYLRGWCDKIRAARAPAFVFNATVIETGKRLTITPVTPKRNGDDEDFLTLFPQSAPHLATAARLSAAFPYVSPSSRALPVDGQAEPNGFHIVDGGYADNEGIVTAVEWIDAILDHRIQSGMELPFKQILILRLEPFHPSTKEQEPLWPLISTMLGPAYAMTNARGASQAERGLLESKLLIASTETKQLEKKQDESDKTEVELQSQLAKVPVPIRNSISKGYTKGKPPGVDPKRRLVNQAVQMAVDDKPGWFGKPEYREALKEDLREKFPELAPLDAAGEREVLRAGALQEKKAQIDELPVIPIYSVSIGFSPRDPEYREPLSWKLTPRQTKEIDEAWIRIRDAILAERNLPPAGDDKVEDRELKSSTQLNRFFKLR